mgnify:CR=1 FL=1
MGVSFVFNICIALRVKSAAPPRRQCAALLSCHPTRHRLQQQCLPPRGLKDFDYTQEHLEERASLPAFPCTGLPLDPPAPGAMADFRESSATQVSLPRC